jgi:hypothetical protein
MNGERYTPTHTHLAVHQMANNIIREWYMGARKYQIYFETWDHVQHSK